jgi:outer membrane immunogenic protein
MRFVLLAVAATALAAGGGAHAQESGFSLGGGYQYLDGKDGNFDLLTLRAGFDFSEYFAVEADGYIGLGSTTVVLPGPVNGSVKIDYGLGGFLRAHMPLGDQFKAFARIGYVYFDGTASVGTVSASFNPDGVAFGGGFEWAFAGPNVLRADYTRYEFDGGANGFGVSYVRRF